MLSFGIVKVFIQFYIIKKVFMKKVILFHSFLFVANAIAYDARPLDLSKGCYSESVQLLEKELRKTVKDSERNRKFERYIEKYLLEETEEGRDFDRAETADLDCPREDTDDCDSSKRESIKEARKVALAKLLQTPEYKGYLPIVTMRDHYSIKARGLCRARDFVLYQPKQFRSEEAAMLAGIQSMEFIPEETPSLTILAWTNDLNYRAQNEVREELYRFVNHLSILKEERAKALIARSDG